MVAEIEQTLCNELSDIYMQNKNMFYAIAFSRLGNKQDAEDTIQEVFLKMLSNPARISEIPAGKRIAYINVTIRNASYDVLRKNKKFNEKQTVLEDAVYIGQPSAEEQVISRFSCEQILEFIDTMSESLKSAIKLKMYTGFKSDNIADILGITEEAAKKRVSRATGRIRHYILNSDKTAC